MKSADIADHTLPNGNEGQTELPPSVAARCPIMLVAVNARYSHSSFSVRTLKANLHELEELCAIFEADITINPFQLAAHIAEAQPIVVGFSIYLWNLRIIETVARILRTVAPEIKLIAGGPELTPDYVNATLFNQCIIGEGEDAFRESCRQWLRDTHVALPPLILAQPVEIDALRLPYHLYNDADIANRIIYVEASRGCPYNCSYCTSAHSGLRLINPEKLLPAIEILRQRGVRQFKFLDRSFTAARDHAYTVMNFLLERITADTTLHFEINTDQLNSDDLSLIQRFPVNTLHLECGIQSLNPRVAASIGRSPQVERTLANLAFLVDQTGADVHADLIFGLPGEDEESFARGFNTLINSCNPPAVQINLLKALPGTSLTKQAENLGLKFNPEPPYELLESDLMDFLTVNRIQRFARCWELVHNRGQLESISQELLSLSSDVYNTFTRLAEYIYRKEGRLHNIGQPRLRKMITEYYSL